MLAVIGIGLGDERDITIKGLEYVKKADKVYLEDYTSLSNTNAAELEKFYGKKIVLADRALVESDDNLILKDAIKKNVVFLVIGDVFSATTHADLYIRAKKQGIKVEVIHNTSILTAIGITGLQLYKFGKTTSIAYPEDNYLPTSSYNAVKENYDRGLHTLCLLDIKKDSQKFMTINEAIKLLEKMEEKENKKLINEKLFAVGCARLGYEDYLIKTGSIKELRKFDFGNPPHCLIIPGKLHFKEEEMLELWMRKPPKIRVASI